jgi:hypothetical protein
MITEMDRKLSYVLEIYNTNKGLKSEIDIIEKSIEQNYKQIICMLFPTIMEIYEQWCPRLGESAVNICFQSGIAFEVIVCEIDGYYVRAQEKGKNAYHNFTLNPSLEEYEVATFIVPCSFYESIKDKFDFTFWT